MHLVYKPSTAKPQCATPVGGWDARNPMSYEKPP